MRLRFEEKTEPSIIGIWLWVDSVKRQEFPKKGSYWRTHKKGSLTTVKQPLFAGKLILRYGYNAKHHCAWLQFNPNKADLSELAAHLGLMLDMAFNTLNSQGVVTYCEFAIDVDGAEFKQYLFIDTALRSSSDSYGSLGTMYVGSRQGNRSITCYDKSKQLKETSGTDLGHPRLRLEAQLRNASHFPLRQIAEVDNPFATLMVIDKALLVASGAGVVCKFRQRLLAHPDAQSAFSTQTKPERKAARHALRELQPTWWNPDDIWGSMPASLEWIKALKQHSC